MEEHYWEINTQKTRLKIIEQCTENKKLKHRVLMSFEKYGCEKRVCYQMILKG